MSIKTMTIDEQIAAVRADYPDSDIKAITFYIDDCKYFRRQLKEQGFAENSIDDILNTVEPFRAVYTLIGRPSNSDYYSLTDFDGNRISINALNGYQKGVILNACYAYYMGSQKHPHGVIKIDELNILAE